MRVHIEMVGKTPLMMHNERLADQDDPITRQIKEYTSKGNQTDNDKETISLLEWRGGIYLDSNDEVCIPTANILRCLRDAGKVTKSGTKITQGVSPLDLTVPIEIGAPRHVEKLIKNSLYFDRRLVKVKTSRVKRTRPKFPKWSLSVDLEVLEDVLNFSAFVNIVELAGRATGLAEARILGFGRFSAVVTKVKG